MMTGQVMLANGVALSYRRHGVGPVVICLHATGHGARDFDLLLDRLGPSAEFISIDWPGQGNSPRDSHPASAIRYAELLGMLLKQLDLRGVVLLGNSIGGAAAIICAARNPDVVRGLVLCNPGGLQPVNWIARTYCRALAYRFSSASEQPEKFVRWFEKYYARILPREAASWRRREIVDAGLQCAPVLAEAWTSFARRDSDLRDLLPDLSIPILFAWGCRDKAVRWKWSKKAALKAPYAKVKLFDAGHSAFLETPEEFDAALTEFLTSLPTSGEPARSATC